MYCFIYLGNINNTISIIRTTVFNKTSYIYFISEVDPLNVSEVDISFIIWQYNCGVCSGIACCIFFAIDNLLVTEFSI